MNNLGHFYCRLAVGCALSVALSATTMARAAPVPAEQRVAVDLRRTTLVVRDVDASLKVYRDALGLVVTYDQLIRTPADAKDDAALQKSRRLVLMRANDDYVGVLGLLQYFKPVVAPRPARTDDDLHAGDVVLVFNTLGLAAKFAKVSATPGVRVKEPPHLVTYPSYDGKGVIHVMMSAFDDPDGNPIELNEVIDGAIPGKGGS